MGDYYESWLSLLALRPKLEAECAQYIFDAIATDEGVLCGLGAARLLKDAQIKTGQVPTELMLKLKQGPGKHIKNHAYTYRQKIDSELTKIGRIQSMKQRAIALAGTALVAVFVGASNLIFQLYYDVLLTNGELAAIIAAVAVCAVLLVVVTFAACIR